MAVCDVPTGREWMRWIGERDRWGMHLGDCVTFDMHGLCDIVLCVILNACLLCLGREGARHLELSSCNMVELLHVSDALFLLTEHVVFSPNSSSSFSGTQD